MIFTKVVILVMMETVFGFIKSGRFHSVVILVIMETKYSIKQKFTTMATS